MSDRRRHPEVDAIIGEVLHPLMIQWSYYEHIVKGFPNPSTTGREALYRWVITMRVMENDMILRLCRLDDEDRRNHSFREALKAVRGLVPDGEAKVLDKRLRTYRANINPLKNKARNWCIAHLQKGVEESLTPQFQLLRIIVEAVRIADGVAGERVEYTFQPSKHDPVIKLRDYLKKPELD